MMDNAWRRRTKVTNWDWHYSQNNSRPLKRRCSIYWGNWETLQLDAHQFTKTWSAASESALKPTSDSNTASGIVAATGSVFTGALNNDMLSPMHQWSVHRCVHPDCTQQLLALNSRWHSTASGTWDVCVFCHSRNRLLRIHCHPYTRIVVVLCNIRNRLKQQQQHRTKLHGLCMFCYCYSI